MAKIGSPVCDFCGEPIKRIEGYRLQWVHEDGDHHAFFGCKDQRNVATVSSEDFQEALTGPEALTEPNFEALYYEAAGRAVEYAQQMGELREELEAERRAHAEKARELDRGLDEMTRHNEDLDAELQAEKKAHAEKAELLEHYRTLADYKQERLERRSGKERRIKQQPMRQSDRRVQLIGSWRES
jgi:hypothetical protein